MREGQRVKVRPLSRSPHSVLTLLVPALGPVAARSDGDRPGQAGGRKRALGA